MMRSLATCSFKMLFLALSFTLLSQLPEAMPAERLSRLEIQALQATLGSNFYDHASKALELCPQELQRTLDFLGIGFTFKLTLLRIMTPVLALKWQMLLLFLLSLVSWRYFRAVRIWQFHDTVRLKFWVTHLTKLLLFILSMMAVQRAAVVCEYVTVVELMLCVSMGMNLGVRGAYSSL